MVRRAGRRSSSWVGSFRDNRFLAEPYLAVHNVSVKHGEQVVFLVRAFTSKCYCEWELLVETVVDGKEQVFRVKDGDQPFRTTAFTTAYKTIYSFDFLAGTDSSSNRRVPGSLPLSLAPDGHAPSPSADFAVLVGDREAPVLTCPRVLTLG
jgi:hypothetical protein